eukprot:TRINITY_DN5842_c0_g1_i1.p1 TRINITY_DN5842_c0_g1~~TRINITY_DN5842_c0_g1_i1.p1  ORF type:complete len:244 (-),score=38.42 TRINITY_DN5842_c0_g1_i1:422-1153(-)
MLSRMKLLQELNIEFLLGHFFLKVLLLTAFSFHFPPDPSEVVQFRSLCHVSEFSQSSENGEPMRILHYGIKEEFKPHFDVYQDISQSAFSGNRVATVFMFLSNVTQGGEIILPHLQIKGSQSKDTTWSDCAKSEYGIKAIKGNALLLFNLHLNATTDNCSLHGSCPVVKGEKWSATKWIRAKAFDVRKYSISVSSSSSDGEECTDEDDNCPQWAATGECQKNPVFMLGTPDYYGTCRKSCQIC